ncbi:MAG: hypothetical protein CR974_00820 [Gammaproteobacteria bacterium]|nr:MAG: hypothetical protein CR974_00820 [Gammaproteobacteria bacterium]
MKKIILCAFVPALFACQAVNASEGAVKYACQSNKSLKVSYRFNAQGLPTQAKAFINGKQRVLPINLKRSNHVDTIFGQEGGYVLAAGYLDKKNYKHSSVLLTSPNNQILFKNCSAIQAAAPVKKTKRKAAQKPAKIGKVYYACQSGKGISVTYHFNAQGLPTLAKAYIKGRHREMPINLARSNHVDAIFGRQGGYVLSSGYLDSSNYKKSSMLLTSPTNEILFKNCSVK